MTLMGLKTLMVFKELLTLMTVMYQQASCREKTLLTLMAFKELMTLIMVMMMMYQPASCREEGTQALRWCVRQNHPKPRSSTFPFTSSTFTYCLTAITADISTSHLVFLSGVHWSGFFLVLWILE